MELGLGYAGKVKTVQSDRLLNQRTFKTKRTLIVFLTVSALVFSYQLKANSAVLLIYLSNPGHSSFKPENECPRYTIAGSENTIRKQAKKANNHWFQGVGCAKQHFIQ